MWHRDDSKPTKYRGILFRSALEAKVAEQFDKLGVGWKYEVPAHEALSWMQGAYEDEPPQINWYLPDFTIIDGPEYLELPLWVEVKPPELLYAVREYVGCEELFEGIHKAAATAKQMHDAQLTEAWKPKRLAEITERNVLVVSAINRNRTLSVLMLPDRVELSRSHPVVCHRQLLRDRAREEREAQWRAEWERQQAEREEQTRAWREQVIDYARIHGKPARFDGWCQICSQGQAASSLVVYQASDGRWAAVCRAHLSSTP